VCSTVLPIRGAGVEYGVIGRDADVKSEWVGFL